MVAAVAQDVDHTDSPPALQIPQTVADVGASHREQGGDLVGRQRFAGEVEQGMDLGDGAIETPAGAEFAPVEDELVAEVGLSSVIQ